MTRSAAGALADTREQRLLCQLPSICSSTSSVHLLSLSNLQCFNIMSSAAASSENTIIPGGYKGDTPSPYAEDENIPLSLRRATHRMQFPPSYVVVGFYRLLTDPQLRVPAWKKCEHGFMRGAAVGLVWVSLILLVRTC